MAYLGFNAAEVAPASDFSALPQGEYAVIITASEMIATKRGDGQMLKLTLQVIEPELHKGRLLWARLNLMNSNPVAVDIAQRELSAICHAVGKLMIQDSEELHHLPLRVKVAYLPAKGEFPEKNDIKAWKPYKAGGGIQHAPVVTQVAPPAPSAPVKAAPAPSAPVNKTPPWKRASAPVAGVDDIPF